MAAVVRLSLGEVRQLASSALHRTGLLPPSCEAIAQVVTEAERDGCKSHGLFRIPGYVKTIKLGKADVNAIPTVKVTSPSVVQVNGRCGFAPLAHRLGLPILAARAKEQGVAIMPIRNILHFASLWHEVEYLAEKGLAGFACVSTKAFVAHGQGSKRIYGTNPMAFSFPREGEKGHLLFDQASAMMARGEISLAGLAGEQLPQGCAVDKHGNPTTDPAAALEGAQLTFGGIKGSNIAMMVELLSAGLTGSPLATEAADNDIDPASTTATLSGELIIAINPDKTSDKSGTEILQHAESLFQSILTQENGVGFLPSTSRHCGSQRASRRLVAENEGVDVPESLVQEIETLAQC
eukprot:m.324169 g.324169  ORF g.324169 m.324169 type:complete len:351 (-) comp16540_c10_seq22:2128-3180(-)